MSLNSSTCPCVVIREGWPILPLRSGAGLLLEGGCCLIQWIIAVHYVAIVAVTTIVYTTLTLTKTFLLCLTVTFHFQNLGDELHNM